MSVTQRAALATFVVLALAGVGFGFLPTSSETLGTSCGGWITPKAGPAERARAEKYQADLQSRGMGNDLGSGLDVLEERYIVAARECSRNEYRWRWTSVALWAGAVALPALVIFVAGGTRKSQGKPKLGEE